MIALYWGASANSRKRSMDAQSGSMSSWDYLDFELEIRESESRGYAVAVHSPAGEAQEEMSFPFDERQLRDKLKDLEIALLRSGGTRRALSTEERTVQEFGQSLFEAVFVGKVGTCYYRSMDQAQQEGKGLRLKLHIKPPNLTVLPWEFLYDPDRNEYLCFSRDTPIVRYTDLRLLVGRLSVEPPLRILGMVASPRDLDPLDVEHEKSLMNEAIEDLQADGLVKLTWLEGETWRDLQRTMRRDGPWHVFHFVGHGDFNLSAQEGLIAFTEKGTGRRHLLRSRDLARLLDGHPSLRVVFLNSYEGARGSEGDPFSGTAATLVSRGIPAVVAMQYQITDKAALEFCSAFYESLADGLPVDTAVTKARVAVSMDSMLEWGAPVLYMHSRDGSLFDISTEKRPSEQPLDMTDQEELLEHEERTAREKERKEQLDTLYAQARRSHQNQDWHAVVDVFEQISEEDQDYPDDEGLLQSALEAMLRERKERDALRRYRHADTFSPRTDGSGPLPEGRRALRVICSYSRPDQNHLEELKTRLVGLRPQGLITEWHEGMITPGHEWEEDTAGNLETSDMVLLLVTPDFMASQYIYEKEIDRAIERHERGEARVIPIIVGPARWEGTSLGKLQALPQGTKPIITWANQDEAWQGVVRGIQQAVEELGLGSQEQEATTNPFVEADRRYAEIKRRHEAGTLTDEEFDEHLVQLMVQDEEGRWWVKSRTTGEWHYYDSTTWIKDTPPGYEPLQGGPSTTPARAPSAAYERLAGYTPEAGTVYVCPRGDYTWSQQSMGEQIPKCPTHGIPLEPRDQSESGESSGGTLRETHRPWWRRLWS